MAEPEIIDSPPCPTPNSTIPAMLGFLQELRKWVINLRFWAQEAAAEHGFDAEVVPDEYKIPEVPEPPSKENGLSRDGITRYEAVSLFSMFETCMNMQQLREGWDAMVRLHERDWNCKQAVITRIQLVRMAATILEYAFITSEQREFRREKAMKQVRKLQRRMLMKMGIPKSALGKNSPFFSPFGFSLDAGSGISEADIDKLFNGGEGGEEDEE